MVDAYFKWKAAEYFAGIIATIIVISICAFFVFLTWMYKKVSEKRLERMLQEWEEMERKESERTGDREN